MQYASGVTASLCGCVYAYGPERMSEYSAVYSYELAWEAPYNYIAGRPLLLACFA